MKYRSAIWALGALLGVALLTGCTGQVTGTPLAVTDTATQTHTTTPRTTAPRTTPAPRTTTPRTTTPRTTPAFGAAIGDCVQLGGTETVPEISKRTCGSAPSNYKVVAIAASHDLCPTDVDGWYANTDGTDETGAFCLDIDWVVGDCYTLYVGWPARVDCAGAGIDAVRLSNITPGTDGSVCDEQSHIYFERQVVACLDSASRSS